MYRSLVLSLLLGLTFAAQALAAPQVVVESLNYEFGEVPQGEQVEYVFRFQNAGDQILELGNVSTSCGCTAALLSSRRVAPGDSGELNVRFDSTRFQGAVHKTVTLETNDPLHPQVAFNLSGTVRAVLLLNPERISWGEVKAGEELEATVTISNQSGAVMNLQVPQTTNEHLTAELSAQQLPAGGQVNLRVRGKFGSDKARISGYVIIATDDKNVPQIRVPVTVRLAK